MPTRVTSPTGARWYEPPLLAAAAAVITVPVLHWAGVRWRTAALVGAVAFVVVAVATWVASTVPGPPPVPQTRPTEARAARRTDPPPAAANAPRRPRRTRRQ
ncbi:hypothetical protein ACTHAM_002975 [Cellulomonas soli]|uniref:hypothetical protein n=1 Tax=Cellulomonas soli TaxID=931535 RepID=UPI003F86EE00